MMQAVPQAPESRSPGTGDPAEPTHGTGGAAPSATVSADAGFPRILGAAVDLLRQGESLLTTLPAAVYTRPVPEAFHASIGGHYRHCLDHVTSLLRAVETGLPVVDYDARARDPRLERDPEFALEQTRQLRARLQALDPGLLAAPVLARCEVSYERGVPPVTRSSLGRELVYTLAHAIHHYALIAVMARLAGIPLPEPFGVAPSTLAHSGAVAGH